jgi:hypothetical protein
MAKKAVVNANIVLENELSGMVQFLLKTEKFLISEGTLKFLTEQK